MGNVVFVSVINRSSHAQLKHFLHHTFALCKDKVLVYSSFQCTKGYTIVCSQETNFFPRIIYTPYGRFFIDCHISLLIGVIILTSLSSKYSRNVKRKMLCFLSEVKYETTVGIHGSLFNTQIKKNIINVLNGLTRFRLLC